MGAPRVPPLNPLRDDSVLRALSSLRGLRGAPEVPHYAERRSLSDSKCWNGGKKWVKLLNAVDNDDSSGFKEALICSPMMPRD